LKEFRSIIFVLVLLVVSSCGKDENLPFSTLPIIELKGLSHETIVEFQDVMTLSIEYTDGDGDLGFEEPDQYALEIRDTRLDKFDQFYIGPLAPLDTLIPISGILDIEFPSLFIFGNAQEESTNFEIKMTDRAGNESNLLSTQTILIKKP